jgi:hypothetical protein
LITKLNKNLERRVGNEAALFLEEVRIAGFRADDVNAPDVEEMPCPEDASNPFDVGHPAFHIRIKEFTWKIIMLGR